VVGHLRSPPVRDGLRLLRRSGVADCFLGKLHPGGEAEFGVDVGEVGLDRARLDEKPCGDVVVAQAFADQSRDVALGGGERGPVARGPFAFASATPRIGDQQKCVELPASRRKITATRRWRGDFASARRRGPNPSPASRRWPNGPPLRRLQPFHLACHAGALDVVHTARHVVVLV
jgi:hypothetical protein